MNTTNTDKAQNIEPTINNRYAQSYKKLLAGIEQAKDRIASEFQGTLESHGQLIQLAMNEAEVLARQTDYPHLLFPSLAMEKIQRVATRQARQHSLRQRHPIFAEAA
ncbi:MAG TPA: hypothetical protein VHY30_06665 [Verrucomicrobiae bacterium]|jgi:hypothetical protein|nr:hypothetical protein [Verrucomicrobiae bacterium]